MVGGGDGSAAEQDRVQRHPEFSANDDTEVGNTGGRATMDASSIRQLDSLDQ